jgi:hypothetical protein
MDMRLQFLESFIARGSDDEMYKVCAYERLVRDLSIIGGLEHWEPEGQAEYRLGDGRAVAVGKDGVMRIDGLAVVLEVAIRSTPA